MRGRYQRERKRGMLRKDVSVSSHGVLGSEEASRGKQASVAEALTGRDSLWRRFKLTGRKAGDLCVDFVVVFGKKVVVFVLYITGRNICFGWLIWVILFASCFCNGSTWLNSLIPAYLGLSIMPCRFPLLCPRLRSSAFRCVALLCLALLGVELVCCVVYCSHPSLAVYRRVRYTPVSILAREPPNWDH